MEILVTGGAGFIGSSVVRLLCDADHHVVVLDDLSTGYRELIDPRCEFVLASLSDGEAVAAAVRGMDAVMHFAASSIIARSFTNPMEYVDNNVCAGVNLLEAMRLAGVRHLVYSSSASVYGEPTEIPVVEDAPKHPLQIYGATKLAFEVLLEGYCNAFNFSAVCLRYFNAYGTGDLQQPVTRAVPRWIQAVLSGRPVEMYWNGQQLRDYVFVDDLARAHVDVLGLDGFHAFNVGSGTGILMSTLLEELEGVLGKPIEIRDCGERSGDPMRLVAATAGIERAVGWRTKVPIREGLRRTLQFYEDARSQWEPHLDST